MKNLLVRFTHYVCILLGFMFSGTVMAWDAPAGRTEIKAVPFQGGADINIIEGAQIWVDNNISLPNTINLQGVGVSEGAGSLGAIRFGASSKAGTLTGAINLTETLALQLTRVLIRGHWLLQPDSQVPMSWNWG